MTDQRNEGEPVTAGDVEQTSASTRVGVSRRELIRGASVALPTILTLRSGSALATTSNNFIGRSGGGGNPQLCLNQDHTRGTVGDGSIIDLGSPVDADVIELPAVGTGGYEYRIQGQQGGGSIATAAEACGKINDPNFQVKPAGGGWESIKRDRPTYPGFCVSSDATASFGNRLHRRHIDDYL